MAAAGPMRGGGRLALPSRPPRSATKLVPKLVNFPFFFSKLNQLFNLFSAVSEGNGPDYNVGDVVVGCDFDSAVFGQTGCDRFVQSGEGDITFDFAFNSNTDDTGPVADHTGGGKHGRHHQFE